MKATILILTGTFLFLVAGYAVAEETSSKDSKKETKLYNETFNPRQIE